MDQDGNVAAGSMRPDRISLVSKVLGFRMGVKHLHILPRLRSKSAICGVAVCLASPLAMTPFTQTDRIEAHTVAAFYLRALQAILHIWQEVNLCTRQS